MDGSLRLRFGLLSSQVENRTDYLEAISKKAGGGKSLSDPW